MNASLRRSGVAGSTAEDGSAVFPTRVDTWLAVVLAGSLVASVAAVVGSAREEPGEARVAGVILAATFGLVFAIAYPTHYTVEPSDLVIRSGFLRSRIPFESIERVYPTRNPLSAPAWSLRRLGIRYRKGRGTSLALISPARQEEFLEILAERAGLIPVQGELRRP